MSDSEAEAKFWSLPEMVVKLFSELDPESVLNLARVVDKDVLKESLTSKVWKKIISDISLEGGKPCLHWTDKLLGDEDADWFCI